MRLPKREKVNIYAISMYIHCSLSDKAAHTAVIIVIHSNHICNTAFYKITYTEDESFGKGIDTINPIHFMVHIAHTPHINFLQRSISSFSSPVDYREITCSSYS